MSTVFISVPLLHLHISRSSCAPLYFKFMTSFFLIDTCMCIYIYMYILSSEFLWYYSYVYMFGHDHMELDYLSGGLLLEKTDSPSLSMLTTLT